MRRVVVISDLHCGHYLGLTPPVKEWRSPITKGSDSMRSRCGKVQRAIWGWFDKKIQELQPIDILIVNGDAIEGKGPRSGGTEVFTTDRTEQRQIATHCITHTRAGKIAMTYGTPDHTGVDEDWEDEIAAAVGAQIDNYLILDIEGVIFNARHFVSRSAIPHGRITPLAREHLWNVIESERGEEPSADVIVRSHVHYFDYTGERDWLGIITPALQAKGTKYGARKMSGSIDVGMVHFDVTSREDWSWRYHIAELAPLKSAILKL